MSKRTPEEIIHSVKRYQQGETSQGAEAKRLGVSKQAFQDWVRIYETYGESGFLRTENRRYSKELKLSAVQAYLNGEGSHAAICKKYGISSRTQLQNWIKMYNGHKELRPSRDRGSDIYMTKDGLRHTKNGLKLSATASSMEMTTMPRLRSTE